MESPRNGSVVLQGRWQDIKRSSVNNKMVGWHYPRLCVHSCSVCRTGAQPAAQRVPSHSTNDTNLDLWRGLFIDQEKLSHQSLKGCFYLHWRVPQNTHLPKELFYTKNSFRVSTQLRTGQDRKGWRENNKGEGNCEPTLWLIETLFYDICWQTCCLRQYA